jgi:hypothetical protein
MVGTVLTVAKGFVHMYDDRGQWTESQLCVCQGLMGPRAGSGSLKVQEVLLGTRKKEVGRSPRPAISHK